jgi:hypothetical protein
MYDSICWLHYVTAHHALVEEELSIGRAIFIVQYYLMTWCFCFSIEPFDHHVWYELVRITSWQTADLAGSLLLRVPV